MMFSVPSICVTIALALGTIEGTAWWWMHPARSRTAEETVGLALRAGRDSANSSSSPSTINDQPSTSSSSPSTINDQPSTSSTTPLPEIYAKSAAMLRCSSGQVFHVQLDESLGLHIAFFQWDGTDTGSVLEAFRHMPEACMGSIGMKLVSKEKPIFYHLGRDAFTQASDDRQASGSSTAEPSSFQHSALPPRGITLVFDHTVFRDPGQAAGPAVMSPPVHAFRAVWVSGVPDADARSGLAGDEFDRLRTIRLKCALTRFRPAHACVIQGAVRGAANGDVAWQAFKNTMLADLKFETP